MAAKSLFSSDLIVHINFDQRRRCSLSRHAAPTSLGKHREKHTGRREHENFIVCFSQTGCCDSNFLSAVAHPLSCLLVSPLIFGFHLSAQEESQIYIKRKNEIALLCLPVFFFVITPVCWSVCRLFHLNNFLFKAAAFLAPLLVHSPALLPATFIILLNLSVWLFFPLRWHRFPLEIK